MNCPVISTSRFDFSLCFELLVLHSIPKIFLIFFGLYYCSQKLDLVYKRRFYYYFKVTFTLFLLVLASVELAVEKGSSHKLYLIRNSIDIFAFGFAGYLAHYSHSYKFPSWILELFWLLQVFAEAIYLNTQLQINNFNFTVDVNFGLARMIVTLLVTITTYQYDVEEYTGVESKGGLEEESNLIQKLGFFWITPLMSLGFKRTLDTEDLCSLQQEDTSEKVYEIFGPKLEAALKQDKFSLTRVLVRTFFSQFINCSVLKVHSDILNFAQPQLLSLLLSFASSYSTSTPQPLYNGIVISILMLSVSLLQSAFLHQYFQGCFRMGIKIDAALVTSVYAKSMKLSMESRRNYKMSEITNLMSVDSGRLEDICEYLNNIWSAPFQIIMAVFFLYQAIGASVFGGVAVMIIMIPVNGYLATRSRTLGKEQMKNRDDRSGLMDEVLTGIKVVKLNAWEESFKQKITAVRNQELKTLKSIAYLSSLSSLTWSITPFLVSLVSFSIYSMVNDSPLNSNQIFVSVSLFNLLSFPLMVFPSLIAALVEASVSIGRLEKYFLAEERVDYVDREFPNSTKPEVIERVVIRNGTFGFKEGTATLRDISFRVNDHQLLAVVGKVGSGKSAVLSALLGEMYKTEGTVKIRGSIAYVPQNAFIMNATIRENILFGKRFDKRRYESVVEGCGLVPDLESLPSGDGTEIGERGINLSGGQKQRVAIARAVYNDADLYLLDDCLSAVDAHVGKHIFDKIFGKDGLLKGKARIFVTHAVQYLSSCDRILMLENGQIVESGSFDTLMAQKSLLHALVEEHGGVAKAVSEDQKTAEDLVQPAWSSSNVKKDAESAEGTIIEKETIVEGSVGAEVYMTYAKACNLHRVVIFILICAGSQGISVLQNIVLTMWADSNDRQDKSNPFFWLSIYFGIGILFAFASVAQAILAWVLCGIAGARKLHNDMLENVLRLPTTFFDTTPLGRVINRFSKDIYVLDESLPRSFLMLFRALFTIVSILAVNTFVNPLYIVFAIPLGFLYYRVLVFYLSTSRQLKRMDSTLRSPIYAHFQETIIGTVSIRAFQQDERFTSENQEKLDLNNQAYYCSVSANRWLALRLAFIGSIIVFASALFGVMTIHFSPLSISPSMIGLIVTYSLTITQVLNWMVRQSGEVENSIVSVERYSSFNYRIKEYIELPQEAPGKLPTDPDDRQWPVNGQIEFRSYSTRYRPGLDLAIKDLSLTVKPKEKIGIVGRTGAGKSSLTLALFRLIEAAGGSILIDGVDISKIGVYKLRSSISIIPQDPFLYAGSIRENLDPFQQQDDAKIWNALEKANLKDFVKSLEGGIDFKLTQSGENLSLGQRQLLCLARALLKDTKILVLDEATASIDVESDSIIQKTIRSEFSHCTILTIAHRLNSVMDADRILVLGDGVVKEFDKPEVLLKNTGGTFYSLAREADLI